MSTLRLRNLLDSTSIEILPGSTNIRILPTSTKDPKILLNSISYY